MLHLGLVVASVVLFLDQLTKWAILTWLDRDIALTSFFNLVLVWNKGVSFGMFDSGAALAPWLLSGLALAVVIALLVWLRGVGHRLTAVGLGLIIGGALRHVIAPAPLGV